MTLSFVLIYWTNHFHPALILSKVSVVLILFLVCWLKAFVFFRNFKTAEFLDFRLLLFPITDLSEIFSGLTPSAVGFYTDSVFHLKGDQ